MRLFLVVLLLVSFMTLSVGAVCAEPFCDWALDSGKVVDWLVCMVFAMMLDEGAGDYQGNWSTGG